MLGTRKPFAEVPYFWTDLADWATAEWVGLTEAPEQEIVRGSVEDGAFCVLHLAGGRLVAALSVGRAEELLTRGGWSPSARTSPGARRSCRRRPRRALARQGRAPPPSSGSSTNTSTPSPFAGSTWDMNDFTRRPVRRSTAARNVADM